MQRADRLKRDHQIMTAIRAGTEPRRVAVKHKLTLARVVQIVERDKRKHKRSRGD